MDNSPQLSQLLLEAAPLIVFVSVLYLLVPRRETEMWTRFESVLLPVMFAAGLLFVAVGINRSLWIDEASTTLISTHSFSAILERLRHENNQPAYFLLLSLWIRRFGISEVALRTLSGLCYLAGGIATHCLGRAVSSDRRVALYSSFCYLISGQAIRQAQNVRMYALLGLLAALSTLLFFRLATNPTKRDWLLYLLITSLGTLTHVWFFFVIGAHIICYLILPGAVRYKGLAASLASVVPFGVLWLPSFLAQLKNGAAAWMPQFHLFFLWDVFAQFYRAQLPLRLGPRLAISMDLGLFFYAGFAALILARDHKRTPTPGRRVRLLVLLTFVPIAVPLFVSIFKPIYWSGRYTIIALPAFAVLLGWALAEFAPRPCLICFCIFMLLVVTLSRIATRAEIPELLGLPIGYSDRRTAEYVLQHAQTGDVLLFTGLGREAVDYYLLRNAATNRFREMNFPPEIATHLGWQDPQAMLKHPDRLASDASVLANDLGALEREGAKVWLFWGGDPGVDKFLETDLSKRFGIEQELDLKGSFYSRVLVLRPGGRWAIQSQSQKSASGMGELR